MLTFYIFDIQHRLRADAIFGQKFVDARPQKLAIDQELEWYRVFRF